MPQCIVIADDLTGANATGVLLKKMNYKAYTVMNMERLKLTNLSDCDCVMYPTDSRGVEPEIAYNRVYNVCQLLKQQEVAVYSKRIDSTLRGNLGKETDAMLDSLGEDYIAIVAPCFPDSGRIVIGGYMLVNGIPLHKTDIAIDPKTPVTISEVAKLFQQQSKYKVSSILLGEYQNGIEQLVNTIKQKVSKGNRILVFDCVTQEDLDFIADAVIKSKLPIVAIDPGVFTATIARKRIRPLEQEKKNRLLAVVGSVNSNTKLQMEELWLSQSTYNVFVQTKKLLEGKEGWKKEVDRVVKKVLEGGENNTILTVTGDGLYPENRIDFSFYTQQYQCTIEELTNQINRGFAEITYRILQSDSTIKGLYTSGGDITVSICQKFETAGIVLIDEVLPLAAYGKFLKGRLEGIHIITKGGSQGSRDAISRCITYLKEKLYI